MIPITYIPRPSLTFRTSSAGVVQCSLEQRPGINLMGSKTIVVYNIDGDNNADDDTFTMDLALFYETQKLL